MAAKTQTRHAISGRRHGSFAGKAAASAPLSHDGSLATLTEEWIVAQIAALSPFTTRGKVETFRGTTSPEGDELIAEMTARRSPYCAVLFEGDRAIETQEGSQDYEPTYGIYIVCQNERDGAARKGDGTTGGTNLMRDLMRNALHDKVPAQSANGFFAERSEFRGVRVVMQRRDAFIMRAEVVVREAPGAS